MLYRERHDGSGAMPLPVRGEGHAAAFHAHPRKTAYRHGTHRIICNRAIIAVVLASVAGGGCSKGFEQKKLGKDSPQADQVRAMVQALRQAGEKGLSDLLPRQAAGELTDSQRQSLRASLMELIRADSVELDRIDRFGPEIYRVTFTLVAAGKSRPAALLLVVQGDQLRWAGRN
jgi:hypothetical protein